MPVNEESIRELAECIYDLDAEVYAQLGSSLGRVFNRDREHCVSELVTILMTRPDAHLIRSEIALIGNMARTIPDKETRKMVMREYDRILKEIMSLPTSFAQGDVIDQKLADLNTTNLKNRFAEGDHKIICISWTYGSGGINIGFKLADKLKINYYDAEIFEAVLKRLDAEKDSVIDHIGYSHVTEQYTDPASAFMPEKKLTLRQKFREFSRYHGLSKQDAVFFNQSDLLCDMAKKEDFIIMGRCGNAIMTNNRIPHVSIYITAPFELRVQRAMEINPGLERKKAITMLKHLDKQHAHYYNFYTGGNWGNANNYDLCINSASYGIDGTVDFILKMLHKDN